MSWVLQTGIASDATEEDRITLNTDAGQHTAMPRVLLQAAAILLSFTSSTWGPGKYTPAAATTMYDSLVRLLLAPTTSVGEGRTPIVLVLGPTTLLQSACGPVVMAGTRVRHCSLLGSVLSVWCLTLVYVFPLFSSSQRCKRCHYRNWYHC